MKTTIDNRWLQLIWLNFVVVVEQFISWIEKSLAPDEIFVQCQSNRDVKP